MVSQKELEKKIRASEARQKRQVMKLHSERNAATARYTKKINAILDKETKYRRKLLSQLR